MAENQSGSMSLGIMFAQSETTNCNRAIGEPSRIESCPTSGKYIARRCEHSPSVLKIRTKPRITSRRHHPMSELSDKAKEMLTDYGAAFLLGWILGGGMGQQLWDSITGVL